MTYDETIQMIERNASAYPNVKSFFYGSVLRLNKERNWKYPVVVLSPRITTMPNGFHQFGFVLWYIDILAKDRKDFQTIQSTAIQTLTEIGIKIADEETVYSVNAPISVFSERFDDICAGAMCDLDVTTKASICANY